MKVELDRPIKEWFPDFGGEEYDICAEWTEGIQDGWTLNTCPDLMEAVGWYTDYVIKGRWPEAEPYIMKHAMEAIVYAAYSIKDRWPEAEPYIMKNEWEANWYAVNLIKGDWPEAGIYLGDNNEH